MQLEKQGIAFPPISGKGAKDNCTYKEVSREREVQLAFYFLVSGRSFVVTGLVSFCLSCLLQRLAGGIIVVLFFLFVGALRGKADTVRISITFFGHRMGVGWFLKFLRVCAEQEAGCVVR